MRGLEIRSQSLGVQVQSAVSAASGLLELFLFFLFNPDSSLCLSRPVRVDASRLPQGVLSSNSPSSDQGWEERQEEDSLLIERILLLVRNVLHVPADLDQEKVILAGLSSCA